MLETQLPQHEDDAGDDAEAERAQRQRVGPALLRTLDDPEDEGGDGHEREDRADDVQGRWVLIHRARHDRDGADEGDHGERQV